MAITTLLVALRNNSANLNIFVEPCAYLQEFVDSFYFFVIHLYTNRFRLTVHTSFYVPSSILFLLGWCPIRILDWHLPPSVRYFVVHPGCLQFLLHPHSLEPPHWKLLPNIWWIVPGIERTTTALLSSFLSPLLFQRHTQWQLSDSSIIERWFFFLYLVYWSSLGFPSASCAIRNRLLFFSRWNMDIAPCWRLYIFAPLRSEHTMHLWYQSHFWIRTVGHLSFLHIFCIFLGVLYLKIFSRCETTDW